ncbi:MAG: DUF3842 family protein [Ruminococcaceae bacterium]|nr:DUF3842 family protein [Oscillospiraceae bacterium]
MQTQILIIDGQGGQLGSQIIKELLTACPGVHITAVGTNTVATAAMRKAGASAAATGENPVIVACRKADIIIGPIGIVIADALLGEVTPAMALAVGQAQALRVLIPMNKCENLVAGVGNLSTSVLIQDTVSKVSQFLSNSC